ncbi:hypothetical protein EV122DRAFT_285352 [Schizophyllum commune]
MSTDTSHPAAYAASLRARREEILNRFNHDLYERQDFSTPAGYPHTLRGTLRVLTEGDLSCEIEFDLAHLTPGSWTNLWEFSIPDTPRRWLWWASPIADRPIPSLPPWARHTLGRLRRLLASPPSGLGCALRLGLRPRLCSGCGASTPGNGPPCTPWHPSPLRTGVLPLRPPGAAESVVPLAVVESTFGSTIPRQAFCSHRSVVGSPPLAFGHLPGRAPSS